MFTVSWVGFVAREAAGALASVRCVASHAELDAGRDGELEALLGHGKLSAEGALPLCAPWPRSGKESVDLLGLEILFRKRRAPTRELERAENDDSLAQGRDARIACRG